MSGKQDFVQLNITHIVKEDLLIFIIVIYLHPLQLTYTCVHVGNGISLPTCTHIQSIY